jgi:outer membrane protein TolC
MKISQVITVCGIVVSVSLIVHAQTNVPVSGADEAVIKRMQEREKTLVATGSTDSLDIDITDLVDTGGVTTTDVQSDTIPDSFDAAKDAGLTREEAEKEKTGMDEEMDILIATGAVQEVKEPGAESPKKETDTVPDSFDAAKDAGLTREEAEKEKTGLYEKMDSLIATGAVEDVEETVPDYDPGWKQRRRDVDKDEVLDLDRVRSAREGLPDISGDQRLAAVSEDYDDEFIHTNIYVTLRECIAMGLEKNLDLTIDRYEPSIAREGIRLEKSVFDPELYGLMRWSGAESPRPYEKHFITGDSKVVVGNTRSWNSEYTLGLSGRTITGIRYDFDAGISQSRTKGGGGLFEPSFSSYVDASLTVPLLQGFGIDVNLAPVRIARNNWRISKQQLSESVQDLITEIIRAYFILYYTREDAAAQEYTLQLAYELKAINEAKVQVGMAAPLEITQAEARIARDEETLIIAKNNIRDAEDNLRFIINYNMDIFFRPKAFRPVRYHLVPLEKPQVYDIILEEENLIDIALKNREALEIAKLQYRNTQHSLTVAKNNLLPELNALGSLGLRGVGGNHDNSRRDLLTGRHPTWSLGMEFRVPVFYNEPIATYRRAKYTSRQAEINLELVKQQIAIEVRTAMRSVKTNRKRIDATRESTRLAREQLLAEQEKYNVGQSTTFQVLEFQEDLADALSVEIQALADWRISVAALARATGTILDLHAVVIDDYYERPDQEEPFITHYIWK